MVHSLLKLLIAFVCGALPFAFWMGLLKGVDIRKHGSGNPGATNAWRVLGWRWGVLCLVLDALKGALPVLLLTRGGGLCWAWALGLAAILGHVFSPFLNFKGGKGVATSLGVLLAIEPVAMCVALAVGGGAIWATGFVSVGSMLGASIAPLVLLAYAPHGVHWFSVGVTFALAVMIVVRHRANLQRLRAGTERRLFAKRGADKGQRS